MSFLIENSNTILNSGKSVVSSEFSNFLNFISGANVVQVGTALLITNQITIIFTNIMSDFISPIISKLTGSDDRFEQYSVTVFGINFKIGDFILSFITFIITLIMIYYLVRLLPQTSMVPK